MIDSRKLEDLCPRVKAKAEKFVAECKAAGVEVMIYSTYRDNESQDYIYAQGRTRPGAIVTKAKGGDSFHNYRVAFDFVPLKEGKAQWSDTKLYDKCGTIAEKCGLEWGGKWKFKDMPHCQDIGGHTLDQFKKKQVPESWFKG